MAREYMCQYGNCAETKCDVLVSLQRAGERARFCCLEHAGLWLLQRSWRTETNRSAESAAQMAVKVADSLRH